MHAREAIPDNWRVLADFDLPSDAGNEFQAMQRVADVLGDLDVSPKRVERLKTAVSEATMNAIEHGNQFRADLPVEIQVLVSAHALVVRITDHGGGKTVVAGPTPDLDLKLAGEQSPRGWGLFLIKNMVDEMRVTTDEVHHTIELIVNLGEDGNG